MMQTDQRPQKLLYTVQAVTSLWVYCAVPWLEAPIISNTIKTNEVRVMQDNNMCETQKVRSSRFLHKHFCILLTVDVEEIDWNDMEDDQ
jgi:hypothetical protein